MAILGYKSGTILKNFKTLEFVFLLSLGVFKTPRGRVVNDCYNCMGYIVIHKLIKQFFGINLLYLLPSIGVGTT